MYLHMSIMFMIHLDISFRHPDMTVGQNPAFRWMFIPLVSISTHLIQWFIRYPHYLWRNPNFNNGWIYLLFLIVQLLMIFTSLYPHYTPVYQHVCCLNPDFCRLNRYSHDKIPIINPIMKPL